jgi:broad specificity phosphatase PhoE
MKKVYLFRHGQIEPSSEARVIGQTDAPLDDTGRSQARWWNTVIDPTAFEKIYCSDLIRSRETADILAGSAHALIAVEPRLREINLGAWDGMSRDDVKARFPGQWEERGRDIAHYRPAGGESFADLAGRVLPVLETVVTGRSEGPIAIVGHAGVNRVILCRVLGMPLDRLFRLGQDYGVLNIIETARDPWTVSLMNLKPKSGWIGAK